MDRETWEQGATARHTRTGARLAYAGASIGVCPGVGVVGVRGGMGGHGTKVNRSLSHALAGGAEPWVAPPWGDGLEVRGGVRGLMGWSALRRWVGRI